jgi:sigma-B regulation protein RsbU (phosphoserine phosphatase)
VPPPVVFQYQQALDQFRREGREPPLLKRMSELISLLDLTTTLSAGLPGTEILDAALLIVMGELAASRGVLLVRKEVGGFRLKAARGLQPGAPTEVAADAMASGVFHRSSGVHGEIFDAFGLEVLCPIEKAGKVIAALGLGPRSGGAPYGEKEEGFLRSVAACAATPIENGLIYDELRRVNQKLSVKVFQLHNLFDISRELTGSFDEETIKNLATTTLMGHLMVSRCALYLATPGGFSLAHERGLKTEVGAAVIPDEEARPVVEALNRAQAVRDLPEGPFKERLLRGRMALAVPVSMGGRTEALLAVGERVSGGTFSEEDCDFAFTLGRQALAALESVRLHRMRVEKQRQDRELEIAREIQRSLFPQGCPEVPGFEVAALNRPCYQVGGDHYDFIPLADGRMALTVADVSGKGTPASILMASVHASLRALAGTASPVLLMGRLNAFLYASTQPNKYVTLFYGELDPATRRFSYVNGGHVPPYVAKADGTSGRLTAGGPVLGLLPDAAFEVGELLLASGDVVAMVTDGATEAQSPKEEEFGDERVLEALRASQREAAEGIVAALGEAIQEWTGSAGCSDDLTLLVFKAL